MVSSRRSFGLCLVLATAAVAARSAPVDSTPALEPRTAFERLKSLGGTWQGRVSDEKSGPPATVVYRLASGGSVVQETLFPGTPHEMISMYHMADGELVLTHYCAMGNQPRMKLEARASTADRLVFVFTGGTNLDPAKDAHVHSGVIEWRGETLHSDWAVWQGGKESGHNRFFLSRKN